MWVWLSQLLPSAPAVNSAANCINAKGAVGGVSYTLLASAGQTATIWDFPPLSTNALAAPISQVIDMNDNGVAVGVLGEPISATQQAFLSFLGQVVSLEPILPAGSQANGINNAGLVVGVCGLANLAQGFVYNSATKAAPILIGALPSQAANPNCYANAINNNGAVVGTSGSNGFLFVDNDLVDLGPAIFVSDINDSGVVVGSVIDPASQLQRAVYWKTRTRRDERGLRYYADPPVEIPLPAGCVTSLANAINNNGDVVGLCYYPGGDVYGGQSRAFIGNISGAASSDMSLWGPEERAAEGLATANDITDNRVVVGAGVQNGQTWGFAAGVRLVDNVFGPMPFSVD